MRLVLAVVVLFAPALAVRADTWNWTGSASSAWNSSSNWIRNPNNQSSSLIPISAATTTLIFNLNSGLQSNQNLAPFTLNTLNFGSAAAAYILTGNPLAFAANGSIGPTITVQSPAPISISNELGLNADLLISGPGNLSLLGPLKGNGGLNMTGTGALTLGGANTYTGVTTINSGTVTLASSASFLDSQFAVRGGVVNINGAAINTGAGTFFFLASGATPAVVNFNSGSLTSTGSSIGDAGVNYFNQFGGTHSTVDFLIGVQPGATGVYTIYGGNANAPYFAVGFRGKGTMNQNGGTVQSQNTFVSLQGTAEGSYIQTAGSHIASNIYIGYQFGSRGQYDLRGGLVNSVSTVVGFQGTATMFQSDGLHSTSLLRLGAAGGGTGTYTLSGGVLETNRVERGGGTGRFNFNGGTLRATGNSTTFVNGLTEAVVQLGGARIDTNGCSITIPQALLHDSTLGSVSDGGLTKIGAGTLILTGANTYSGGTVVTGGTLSVANDSFLGAPSGGITLQNNGRLVFTGSNVTTGRNFNLNYSSLSPAVNGTITYNGSTIIGGFLESPGHVIGSTGATLIGTTLTGSAAVNVNGPAAFQNVTNSGAISVPTGSTLTWVGTNAPSGLVTVQGSTNVANFTSSGYLNIHPGGTVTNTQGRMTLGGGSVTTIGLYNPANGQVTPGGTLNIGPGDLRVQGGFLRNNGVITGSGNLIIDYGGLVRGAGDIDLPQAPIRINGGQLLAGNSPGLTRITNFSLVSTGVTGGDFSNATGIAGPPIGSTGSQLSGWSVFEYGNSANTGGSAVIEGTPGNKAIWRFQTVLDSGNYSTPGPPANFDPGAAWIWQIVRPRSAADVGNPNNITPINTVAQISILDTATMQNVPLSNQNLNSYLRFDDSGWDWGSVPPGLRGTFSFTFLPDALGNPNRVVALVYTPVPEPGWMLSVVAAAFAGWQVRRRRISERWAPPVGRQSELPPAGRSET